MHQWFAVVSTVTEDLTISPPPRTVTPTQSFAKDGFNKWRTRIGVEEAARFLSTHKVKIAGPFTSRKEARSAKYETSPTAEELRS